MNRKTASHYFCQWGSYTYILTGLNEELLDIKRALSAGSILISDALEILPNNAESPKIIPPSPNALTALYQKITDLNEAYNIVTEFLETLPYYDRRLLTLRYLRHKSWDAIAYAVHLSDRQCFRVHNRLLDAFINFYNNKSI